MPDHLEPARLAALGHDWISAWNSRDLERVLALYTEDSEMTSDRIPALGLDASGTLRGMDRLRAYWGAALKRLPPGARTVFVLHDVEGYRHDEIGEILGVSVGTSKSQLHKARLKLRKLLKKKANPRLVGMY